MLIGLYFFLRLNSQLNSFVNQGLIFLTCVQRTLFNMQGVRVKS